MAINLQRESGKREERLFIMVTQPPEALSGSGVLLSGTVPPLADAYYARDQTGPGLLNALHAGDTIVLVHGEETSAAPAAQGGTGKTQLAVEYTHALWRHRTVEIIIWVTAASRESIVSGFAQAANTLDASQPDESAEAAATRLVAWLAHTRRPWALILDDLAEVNDLEDLWPSGASGRVLITTRLPATSFEGKEVKVVPVGGMSRREALDYLSSRLTDYPDQRIEALDLGEDLDGLPLGLAQATAVMTARRQSCREFRAQLAARRPAHARARRRLPAGPGIWSIAAECAHELTPSGLAWPTLVLAAMLDHNGIPGAVLTSPAACGYIAGRPSTAGASDQNMARAAINNLAAAGLFTIDPASAVRTVRMHASVQAAVRAYLPAADLEMVVLAAADALLETWPDGDGQARRRWAGPRWRRPSSRRRCATAPGRCATPTDGGGAVEARGSSGAVPGGPVTGEQPAVGDRHRVLEVDDGHQHPAARPGAPERRGGPGPAGRGIRGGGPVSRRHLGVPGRPGRPGAEPRPDQADIIAARSHLAHAYFSAGRPADADWPVRADGD